MSHFTKVIFIILILYNDSQGVKKVRYRKYKDSKSYGIYGSSSGIYEFLNRITPPKNVQFQLLKERYEDLQPYTTPYTTRSIPDIPCVPLTLIVVTFTI